MPIGEMRSTILEVIHGWLDEKGIAGRNAQRWDELPSIRMRGANVGGDAHCWYEWPRGGMRRTMFEEMHVCGMRCSSVR